MTVSSDFFRGCAAGMAVKWYFLATAELATALAAMFKSSFPEYHEKYAAAFKAGVWEESDPGPWLGRAIVYKLQVQAHVDGLDDGPTACFPLGRFTGGEIYFPDLGLKLA